MYGQFGDSDIAYGIVDLDSTHTQISHLNAIYLIFIYMEFTDM